MVARSVDYFVVFVEATSEREATELALHLSCCYFHSCSDSERKIENGEVFDDYDWLRPKHMNRAEAQNPRQKLGAIFYFIPFDNMAPLPIVKINGEEFFINERLGETRPKTRPTDAIPLDRFWPRTVLSSNPALAALAL